MIHAKEVSLTYRDGTKALHELSFQIEKGDLIFIIGPSGSGKTSLMKLLIGSEKVSSGEVTVFGEKPYCLSKRKLASLRRRIGPIFQDFRLIQGKSAIENVLLGLRFLKWQPIEMKKSAQEALEKVGLWEKSHRKVENLSWGEGQRVSIARAVARKPELILADEPTGNLDHDNAVKILQLLASFRNQNTTVIITTHAVHLLEDFRNITIMHMEQGKMNIERRA
ncbi:MAG: ATP-binding cassette domain-containing protein [Vallitaleaceae bacterium]|nr:ATP-binding cassette domain-containing protein [Vallitaleaceae bacterium]